MVKTINEVADGVNLNDITEVDPTPPFIPETDLDVINKKLACTDC